MEVAGVVLGAIPVCLLVLEGWEAVEPRVKTFWHAHIAISRYVCALRGHRDNLEVIIKTMLHGCMPIEKIERDSRTLLTEDWSTPTHIHLASKLRSKHGENYQLFQAGMQGICNDIKAVVIILGLWPSRDEMSNEQLDIIVKQHRSPSSGLSRVQTRFRFTFKHKAIKSAFTSLATDIDSLSNRLKNNQIWQNLKHNERVQDASDQVQRQRHHLKALAHEIERATASARHTRSVEFAILLDSGTVAREHMPQAARYLLAFHDQSSWKQANFHVSDTEAVHDLSPQHGGTPADIEDIWKLIQTLVQPQQCIELHLDLRGQPCLTGNYIPQPGSGLSTHHNRLNLISARGMLGKTVPRASRLQTAAIFTSWVQLLYGTPFMTTAWAADDIKFNDTDPGTLPLKAPLLCLRTGLDQVSTALQTPAPAMQGAALFMLGIFRIELYTNKPCSGLRDPTHISTTGLANLLNELMETEAHDLPIAYARAVSDCWRLGHMPSAFDAEFGDLTDRVTRTAAIL
ncbi:unnamed protein product [Zymoseptoria tritici ST99CH_1E4]|uniref:Prion-inhibition and propagation HeLo domain-containing protein n=1 Tax=Zymoseptoria tritici ST99CH_1E4 TaxID=1276532 RepID=A0A2H1G4U9_ZYMTR|nr:unnamed protein product [Zymoseptoria tritici ST99CH_1E4]